MKSSIWIGITASLVTAITSAQASPSKATEVVIQQQGTTAKYLIIINEDGSASMINMAGQVKLLPKSLIEGLHEVDKNPSFESSQPCAGLARSTNLNNGSK